MSGAAAPLIEIFCSIQGEGRFVGVPMAFVRVAKCPIRCRYCDTPHSYTAGPTCAVRSHGAHRDETNPVAPARAFELAGELSPRGVARVSITGGEPLLYPDFVREFGLAARGAGWQTHLETAALDPAALRACAPAIDHLSADYKLPGTLERGDPRQQHIECVQVGAAAGLTVDLKLVLTAAVARDDIAAACAELSRVEAPVVLILQPVTPFGAVTEGVDPATVRWAWEHARGCGLDVRVVPQVHRQLGVE